MGDERVVWANCAALWGRLYILSAPLWGRLPDARRDTEQALLAALRGASSLSIEDEAEDLVARLDAFSIEDDGSAEWQYGVDLIGSLTRALRGSDASTVLSEGTAAYLDSAFTELANKLAISAGRPVSQVEAERSAADDPIWREANAFVRALTA